MQRARRLVAVATVAALGVLALGACDRSDPATAAYVGGTTYSVQRVDRVYDEIRTRYQDAVRQRAAAQGKVPSPQDLRPPVTRQDVVDVLVGIDLGKRLLAEKHITAPDLTSPADAAPDIKVPADTQYAGLWAEWVDMFEALQHGLPPAELSDANVMAVYGALVKAGAIQPNLSVAQARSEFGTADFIGKVSAVRAALREQADKLGVDVNPRFRPLRLPAVVIASGNPVVYSLPYGGTDEPVTDLDPIAP